MTVEQTAAVQAERVAVLYRRIVLLVGAQLLWSCGGQMFLGVVAEANARAPMVQALIGIVLIAASLAFSVANAVFTYQLMRELDSPVPWLWAIAMFVPCLNVIMLLVLSARAQAWCKERGIRVGLLGPTKESIAELKRRSMVDRTFE